MREPPELKTDEVGLGVGNQAQLDCPPSRTRPAARYSRLWYPRGNHVSEFPTRHARRQLKAGLAAGD
jgi:hypothetical protein